MSKILRIYYHLEGISRLVYARKLCRKHEYVMGITALKKKTVFLGFHFLKHFSYSCGCQAFWPQEGLTFFKITES